MKHITVAVLLSLAGFGLYVMDPHLTPETLGGMIAGIAITSAYFYVLGV